ncbi:MAG: ABC transporter substrate-binding protein, partial [Halanaerobiales bacterium]
MKNYLKTFKIFWVLLVSLILISGMAHAESTQTTADSVELTEFHQSPELEDEVEEGELPPLEERLPDNPVVVEPVEDIGEYGGTWNRAHLDNDMGWWRMINEIENFHNWPGEASTEMTPNLVQEWEWNEDKTEVVVHFVEGIKWSDGEELTVDDFLFWWEDMVLDDSLPQSPPSGTHTAGDPMEV